MDETANDDEHNCQLFTDLDQLKSIKENDASITINIEQGVLLQTQAFGSACLGNGGKKRKGKYSGTDTKLV